MPGSRHESGAGDPDPGMTPILLAPWGRNGSTLVMSLLAAASEVLAPPHYPFERHQLLHFLRAAEVLAGAVRTGSTAQSGLMPGAWDGVVRPVAGLPFASADTGDLVSELLVGLWDGWVRHLRSSGRIEPSKRFYAEKSTVEVVEAFARRRPLHVVFIARDPRDLFASSMAFNTARGNFQFGWSKHAGSGELVARFVAETTHCLDALDRLPPSASRIVLRYEDLVRHPDAVIDQLSRRLGVRLTAAAAAIPPEHRTAPSAAASVGRWKHDLPAAIADALADLGRDLFARLGYD